MDISARIDWLDRHLLETRRESRSRPRDATSLGRGYSLHRDAWESLDPAGRHLARVVAANARASGTPVVSHQSAAVLLGLPVGGRADVRVHFTTSVGGANRSSAGVVRHRAALAEDEITDVRGIRCTTPNRTILDLARFGPAAAALSCADAHVRQEFRAGRTIDEVRLEVWRDKLAAKLAGLAGERGVRKARDLLELVDPRKDSPLESISHLHLNALGFEVALQAPVCLASGSRGFVDFELLGLDVFGECDGKLKYVDEAVPDGLAAAETVYREKRRQEWIEASTRKRMIRWGWPEARSLRAFTRMLEAFGIPIPSRRLAIQSTRWG